MQAEVPFVLGIHANRGICHDGLRAGGSDYQIVVGRIAGAIGDVIFKMIEMTLGVAVYDLFVTHCSKPLRIPVDHTYSPVDQAFLVEIHKGIDHSFGEFGIHGELCTVPVAGGAEFAKLLEDDSPMLLLPFPCIFEELFAGDILFRYAHTLEFGHHLAFGCDRCVVGTRYPAGILAIHAGLADEHVIKGVVEHVAHMKYTRHIGRRYHNGIWFA